MLPKRDIKQITKKPFQTKTLSKVDEEAYRAINAMNPSTLVRGFKGDQYSARALHHAYYNNSFKKTPAITFGLATHTLLFQPELFHAEYAIWSNGRRAGKKWNDFVDKNIGKEILTEDEYLSLHRIINAISDDRHARQLLCEGEPETPLLAPIADVQCKGRLDWITNQTLNFTDGAIVDLKTTHCASQREFGRVFRMFHYALKKGMYQHMLEQITGVKKPVYLIVAESKPPCDVAVMHIPDAALQAGLEDAIELLEITKECIKADHWPGVSNDKLLTLEERPWDGWSSEPTLTFNGQNALEGK